MNRHVRGSYMRPYAEILGRWRPLTPDLRSHAQTLEASAFYRNLRTPPVDK